MEWRIMTRPKERDEVKALSLALAQRAMKAARATFTEDANTAYSVDPVFARLRRNRVNAELLKSALRLGAEADQLGYGPDFQTKIARTLLAGQKQEGCWHEIHPNYDQPSALATAFIGEALLEFRDSAPQQIHKTLDESLQSARSYVLSKEVRPGFFIKSEKYLADHLNVDASCGAFLAQYAIHTNDAPAAAAAQRAASHIADEQFPDGAFPYTTADDGPPYPLPLHVPCIHYQGVTGYYLAKIHQHFPSEKIRDSLVRGAHWLSNTQRSDGRFDWSKSHMMFAYQLTGAYAFAAALFAYAAKTEPAFDRNATRALERLDSNLPGLAMRWERSSLGHLAGDIRDARRAAWWPAYPFGMNAQRLGYGIYRQLARQRSSKTADAALFHFLKRTLRLQASTIEPSKNFPDLFMTAEVADCLTFVGAIRK